jgi:TonB family protein
LIDFIRRLIDVKAPIICIALSIAMLTGTARAETPRIKQEMLLHWVRPQYPYEARSRQIQGSGLFLLSINTKTGLVTKVRKVQSTGSPILDNAFTAAVWYWGFKPNTPKELLVPITFTMRGNGTATLSGQPLPSSF